MAQHSIFLSDDMSKFVRDTLSNEIGLSRYLQRLIIKDIYDSGLLEVYKQHVLTYASRNLEDALRKALPHREDDARR